MEIREFRSFVAVAEQLNFGRAAADLGIGQPAVSQHVARLERGLGVLLFDRSSRTVRLTEAGLRLLPEARAVLAAAERARSAARDGIDPQRLFRIGTSSGLGDRLDTVLDVMRSRFPEVGVELVSVPASARLDRVRSGQLDAAFVRGVDAAPGLEFIPVWEDELVAAIPARHPLAERPEIALAELMPLSLRIVPRAQNPPLVDLVMAACARAGLEPTLGPWSQSPLDTLAQIGAGSPSWTPVYAAQARTMISARVAFRRIVVPELTTPELTTSGFMMPTALAVPAGTTSGALAPLLSACDAASRINHET